MHRTTLFATAIPLISLVLVGCQAVVEPRSTMTVEDIVDAFTNQPGLPVTNPQDVTSEVCSSDVACSDAVKADELTIYRFDDQKDAARFTEQLGQDGYRSDWIVLEYPSAKLDADSRLLSYATTVDGMWASE